jgi:hypothetical protein
VASAVLPALVILTTVIRVAVKLHRLSDNNSPWSARLGWDDFFLIFGCMLMITGVPIVWTHSGLVEQGADIKWFYVLMFVVTMQHWYVNIISLRE